MNATITGFNKAIPNSGFGRYTSAVLSCGHGFAVTLVPYRGICFSCGAEQEAVHAHFTRCACGSYSCSITFSPDPWSNADIIQKIGDTVDCETCTYYAEQTEALRAMAPYSIHHARHNGRTGSQAGWRLYRRDPDSPSGVMLAGYAPDTPEVSALLFEKKFATCSPTEGRTGNR